MYCSNCGKEISNNEKFCSNCGTPIFNNGNLSKELPEQETYKQLLADLSVALPIYKQIAIYSQELEELKKEREKVFSLFYSCSRAISIGFITFVLLLVSLLFTGKTNIFTYLIAIVAVVGGRILIKNDKQEIEEKVANAEEEIQDYINKSLCPELYCIPEKYQYYLAVNSFYEYLSSGRATNLKEAMNLYEEQLHRWQVESNQANQTHILNQISAQQRLMSLFILTK